MNKRINQFTTCIHMYEFFIFKNLKETKKIPAWKVDDECVDNNVIEELHFLRSRENVLWLLDTKFSTTSQIQKGPCGK